MKVLQINACRDYKSTGVIVKAIGETAEKNGIEMYYAYQTQVEIDKNGYQIGGSLDWKWHAFLCRLTGKEGYASKRATKKLIKWIKKLKPDIVHLHNLHSHYINFNILCDYLAENNILTVVTLHDCWYFTGKCSHYVAVGCDKWKTNCGSCPLIKSEVPSWFFDPTGKVHKDRIVHINNIKNLYIVGCSEWISNEARKSLIETMDIMTIRNGVDLEIFKPTESTVKSEYNIADKFVVLGFAHKWCDLQNKEAVQYICENLSDDMVVLVVGCNDEQQKYLELFRNVVAVGYIKEQIKMAEIFSAADVFVNLTHADTLPTVNMESIACGTPVITYDCCGSPELVLDGCGYVVPENDYVSVLDKINLIKQQPCTEMQNSRQLFDKNEKYKIYIELYKKIAGLD